MDLSAVPNLDLPVFAGGSSHWRGRRRHDSPCMGLAAGGRRCRRCDHHSLLATAATAATLKTPRPPLRPHIAASRAVLGDLASPAHLSRALPAVGKSSLYYNFTLSVTNAPGGHVSVALDTDIRNLGSTIFLAMGVQLASPIHLVHVAALDVADTTTTPYDLLYYMAIPQHPGTFEHISHFAEYCGGYGAGPPLQGTTAPSWAAAMGMCSASQGSA